MSSITAVGTLDKTPTKAQTLPVPIVGYTLLAAVKFNIMDWFEKKAQEIKLKEIESLHKEVGEREEAYFEEVKKAGYDNTHDYENMVIGKFLFRVFLISVAVIVFFVWWLS